MEQASYGQAFEHGPTNDRVLFFGRILSMLYMEFSSKRVRYGVSWRILPGNFKQTASRKAELVSLNYRAQ